MIKHPVNEFMRLMFGWKVASSSNRLRSCMSFNYTVGGNNSLENEIKSLTGAKTRFIFSGLEEVIAY